MKQETPTELKQIFAWIDAHQDEFVKDLQRLVRQPSISAQNIGLRECAALVCEMMHEDGLPAQQFELSGGPPIVMGELQSKRNKKKLMAYAHYDVQPPEPLDKWVFPPFSGEISDGRVWGRGATDNKSGLLAFVKAAEAWMNCTGDVPVTLKFMFEGEEEIGSPHLGPFVAENPEMFQCDAMHCLDGGMNSSEPVPEIDLGLKSVLYVELVAHGANSDIHSLNAPLVPQPAWDLVRALNTLIDEKRHILIEDWYEGWAEPDEDDIRLIKDKVNRMDIDQLKKEWGLAEFALGRDGFEAMKARAFEPTCNICGLTAGYQGPGDKTIVPCEARAKIDFRLPPFIDPSKSLEKLRRHLDKNGFKDIEVISVFGDSPEPPYKISVKENISQAVIEAAEMVYGIPPIINGVSAEGTILRHVWMPTVLTGFAQPDCNLHAPNESCSISAYMNGIKYAAAIMWNFGNMK